METEQTRRDNEDHEIQSKAPEQGPIGSLIETVRLGQQSS